MRPLFIALRVAGALAVVAAIVGQLIVSLDFWTKTEVRDISTSIANFFSFFTIQANVASAVTLAIGAVLLLRGGADDVDPRWYAVLRACVTTYMVTTGVVYNLLLRGVELPQGSTLGWSNEVLHVVIPVLLLADWLFAPGRRRLGWGVVGVIVIYPIVWIAYTLIRGPFIFNDLTQAMGWYPYPFLNPLGEGGYGTVVLWSALIAVLIGAAGVGVVAVSRTRRA
jgi:hypothetical protein